MNEGYNGWANYETWATGLWVSNDPETYGEARQLMRVASLVEEDEE